MASLETSYISYEHLRGYRNFPNLYSVPSMEVQSSGLENSYSAHMKCMMLIACTLSILASHLYNNTDAGCMHFEHPS
jgi:hypothetical protein